MRTIVIAVMMVLLWAVPSQAADSGFKQGATEIGKGIREGIKETKRKAPKQGRTIGEWFRGTGKKAGEALRKMGRDIRKFLTGK
jgi:hypothetical protein